MLNFSKLSKLSALYLLAILALVVARGTMLKRIDLAESGVRFSSLSGVVEKDLGPGYHWELPFLHKVFPLPSRYLFLNYSDAEALTVRTKDNNTVHVDVSIPYRIKPGECWAIAKDGNHQQRLGKYRFEIFAKNTANDVLLAELAKLSSEHFYKTDTRLEVAAAALEALNEKLAPFHLEADSVLIRQAYFRPEYEKQLSQIQLNEQTKLLDAAKSRVATEQQKLDNYNQGTTARVAAKEQDWARRLADLERVYMVGAIEHADDQRPGAARAALGALSKEARGKMSEKSAKLLGIELEDVSEAHLLGIKNIQAETMEYKNRVYAEADGVANRLEAEGDAKVAQVQARYEKQLNQLLDSPGGRAYVAYRAADNVKFAQTLVFQSDDGIPFVYRLRDFAQKFMGSSKKK